MVLEEDGKETKYKRVTPPENLRKNIVGLWEYDDGVITEFTTGGILLDSRLSNDEQVYYSILSDYTIALYHDSQKQDFFGFIGCISSGKDIMVLGRQGDEPDRELKKLPGHQNLATDILGLWKQDGDDENLLEFVNNGTYIQHLTNTINEYQVISDNSIIMDGQYVNVIKISKNELMVRQWDTEYFDEIVTFVK
ncbi:hypothetical protein SDC9_118546 [bioreactor metagenome]|uniref:Uncharacterized protein n=1 Tax=bioreactor metagenome TaxID=1076179 RepID=A0A645C2J2_9ZZZZ